ncbi:MAG: hypothetical protein OEY93_01590 [Anaerolineae bacterium]|nr:hypothetical protein [Anaerolineae bacterium]
MNKKKVRSFIVVLIILAALGASVSPAAATPKPTSAEAICAGQFTDKFTLGANCWDKFSGKWFVKNGKFQTRGVASAYATTGQKGVHSNFVYTARMKRRGCTTCYNFLLFRGTPAPLGSLNSWASSYMFMYSNAGKFTVYKIINSLGTILITETDSPAINKGGWNKLQIRANGTSFKFFINGTQVGTISDGTLPSGRVGIGMYRNSDTTGHKLLVDWAKLVK